MLFCFSSHEETHGEMFEIRLGLLGIRGALLATLQEIKALGKPPDGVRLTLEAGRGQVRCEFQKPRAEISSESGLVCR